MFPIASVAEESFEVKGFALLAGLGLIALLGSRFEQNQASAHKVAPLSDSAPMLRGIHSRKLSFPVENFQGYASPFGYRSSSKGVGKPEFHAGLDLAAPSGSYIRSWMAGHVLEVSSDPVCGTSIQIRSGRWVHIYCHMQGSIQANSRGRYLSDRSGSIQIWSGQSIQSGEVIGRVGMTGRTTGPHLHWGLQYDDHWVDPALVLGEMYRQQAHSR
ncbi:MAG: M23 family metallopeptidase [Leptolyngbyaceae bacterium]|nr:M23 family metallopeptidase [Leptolyngbyaceae bacterium]